MLFIVSLLFIIYIYIYIYIKSNLSLGTQISSKGRKFQIWKKLTARCPDNVDVMRDSVRKIPSDKAPENLVFHEQRILKKVLQLYPYRIQIKHKLTPANMEFLVSVINHYHNNGMHLFWDNLYIWFVSE